MLKRKCSDARLYQYMYNYYRYVKEANGEEVRICREAFLGVHGLQNNSRERLRNIQTAIAGVNRCDLMDVVSNLADQESE